MEKSFHMIKKPTLIKVLFDSVGQSFRFLKQNQLSLESSMIVAVKQFKCEINNQLCKPSYSNCHLEMGVCKWDSTPLHFWCTTSRPTTKEVRFCLHIKDFKWGRKCVFMNCASRNWSPQQIPLQQLPFANEAITHYCCRAFWVMPISVLRCATQRQAKGS